MSEEFGPTFVTVTDEDGKEIELELLFPIEYNGQEYRVFLSAEVEGEEMTKDDGFIILKIVEEQGEQLLSTCDDEDELTAVYDLAMEELFNDEDEE